MPKAARFPSTVTSSRCWQAAPAGIVVVGRLGAGKTASRPQLQRMLNVTPGGMWPTGASDLTGTDGDIRNALSIAHNLSEVLRGWLGPGQATLVIDGLDATRMSAPVAAPAHNPRQPPASVAARRDRAGVRPEALACLEEALLRSAHGEARSKPYLQSVGT